MDNTKNNINNDPDILKQIDKAIEHAKSVATLHQCDNPECAKQHNKLAGWLRELKDFKEKNQNNTDNAPSPKLAEQLEIMLSTGTAPDRMEREAAINHGWNTPGGATALAFYKLSRVIYLKENNPKPYVTKTEKTPEELREAAHYLLQSTALMAVHYNHSPDIPKQIEIMLNEAALMKNQNILFHLLKNNPDQGGHACCGWYLLNQTVNFDSLKFSLKLTPQTSPNLRAAARCLLISAAELDTSVWPESNTNQIGHV